MDRLASEGLVLTSAYSTPSCSPSRATAYDLLPKLRELIEQNVLKNGVGRLQ